MAATREQLLALKPGQELRDGDMRAYRPDGYPGKTLNIISFSKRYLEGKMTLAVAREWIRDILPDPWEMAAEHLAEQARAAGAHSLDGRAV